jgi:hypothetical protein
MLINLIDKGAGAAVTASGILPMWLEERVKKSSLKFSLKFQVLANLKL